MRQLLFLLFSFFLFVTPAPADSPPGSCLAPAWNSPETREALTLQLKAVAPQGLDKRKADQIVKAILHNTHPKVFPAPEHVLAVIKVESDFNPTASNPYGPSKGLMQVNVAAHKLKSPYDIDKNIAAGVKILREYDDLHPSQAHTFIAYNAGPRNANEICKKSCRTKYVDKVNQVLKKFGLEV